MRTWKKKKRDEEFVWLAESFIFGAAMWLRKKSSTIRIAFDAATSEPFLRTPRNIGIRVSGSYLEGIGLGGFGLY